MPAMPSTAPSLSLAPSLRPSEDPCPGQPNHDALRMVLTPDSTDPGDVYVQVFRRNDNGSWRVDPVYEIDDYSSGESNQESRRCFWIRGCYKVTVFSRNGVGIGDGSFTAYWNGKYYMRFCRFLNDEAPKPSPKEFISSI